MYEIKLATIDNADIADSEWKLRPYMNTTKKREFLANEPSLFFINKNN